MNERFDIFIRSVEDELLEEAQLSFPKGRGLSRMLALAACLCIITGVYFAGTAAFGATSEEKSAAPENIAHDTTYAAQTTVSEEISTETTLHATTTAAAASPLESARSMLPANAVVCSYSETDNLNSVDFSIGSMKFTLYTVDTSEEAADSKRMNVLIPDEENESISWYSDDGDTEYTLELNEGDFELLYDTAEEIAENLGLEIS